VCACNKLSVKLVCCN